MGIGKGENDAIATVVVAEETTFPFSHRKCERDAVVDQADAKVQTGAIWGLSAGPHQAHKRGNNAYEGGKIG
ncbi:hypothetical protein QYF36_005145 [Acer negundo]|nr:hypothetical protein QYF36_005145 [Acer negundo]